MEDRLAPCPFCGGEAKLDAGTALDCTGKPPTHAMIPFAFARCTGCGIDYGNIGGQDLASATREVVDHWNRRAQPLAAPAPSAMATGEDEALRRIAQVIYDYSYSGEAPSLDLAAKVLAVVPRATPPAAPAAVAEARIGDDMGSGNVLRLIRQDDGDVCVSILAPDGSSLALEVCTAQGGTRSPGVATHLRAALAAAASAERGERRADDCK